MKKKEQIKLVKFGNKYGAKICQELRKTKEISCIFSDSKETENSMLSLDKHKFLTCHVKLLEAIDRGEAALILIEGFNKLINIKGEGIEDLTNPLIKELKNKLKEALTSLKTLNEELTLKLEEKIPKKIKKSKKKIA